MSRKSSNTAKYLNLIALRYPKFCKYCRKNHLGLIMIFLMIAIAGFTMYFQYIEPDIRLTSSNIKNNSNFKFIERVVDKNSRIIFYCSIKPSFINKRRFKSGFIDKVEIVPLSMNPKPIIEVTRIQKVEIPSNKETEIEIYFSVIFPRDYNNKLFSELLINAFDNTGKIIDKLENGIFARMNIQLYEK